MKENHMNISTELKFRLANNLPEIIKPEFQDEVIKILEKEDIKNKLPKCQECWVVYEGKVSPNISLVEAHQLWTKSRFPKLPTLSVLPQQSLEATTPQTSLIRVSVECIDKKSGGMDSFYGFEGYYFSLLVSVSEKHIWDARGEPAS
jgi:hypothetical protein